MNIIYYPDEKSVTDSLQVDDPVLILIKHDQSEVLQVILTTAASIIYFFRRLGVQ